MAILKSQIVPRNSGAAGFRLFFFIPILYARHSSGCFGNVERKLNLFEAPLSPGKLLSTRLMPV
jgi:hypothetical protein